jgi:hypothetical protein
MCAAHAQPTLIASNEDQRRRVSADDPLDVQIANLQRLINEPPTNSRVIDITPELAEWVLDKLNANNRPKKFGKIAEFAKHMTAGEWGLTGDTVKFSKTEGLLRDGQNRLMAVTRSNKTLKTHAVFGIDPRLFVRMDIGKNRSTSDTLAIMGVERANRVAQACRWLIILTGPEPKNRALSIKNDVMQRFFNEKIDANVVAFQHSISEAIEVKRLIGQPVGPVAALHYLFAKTASVDEADRFMKEWRDGKSATKAKRAPTIMLQDRLRQIASEGSGRVHEAVRIGLICKAWKAFREKRSTTSAEMQFNVQSDSFAVDFRGLI